MSARVLVTGGAGFIGSHLAAHLLERGNRVRVLAMDAPGVAGKVYNVACGARVTLDRLVDELRELLGSEVKPFYADPRPGDIRDSVADLSLARAELGYEPAVLLREGLQRTIQHYRDDENFNGSEGRLIGLHER